MRADAVLLADQDEGDRGAEEGDAGGDEEGEAEAGDVSVGEDADDRVDGR